MQLLRDVCDWCRLQVYATLMEARKGNVGWRRRWSAAGQEKLMRLLHADGRTRCGYRRSRAEEMARNNRQGLRQKQQKKILLMQRDVEGVGARSVLLIDGCLVGEAEIVALSSWQARRERTPYSINPLKMKLQQCRCSDWPVLSPRFLIIFYARRTRRSLQPLLVVCLSKGG